MKDHRPGRTRRILILTLAGVGVYLGTEAFLPPDRQPSARACVAAIHAYQAVGSPALKAAGFRCRYRPTCSHYAEEAIARQGTLRGTAMALGRLWRCSPWGGCGYDPVEASLAGPRLQELTEEEKKALREAGKAAGTCVIGCVLSIIVAIAAFVANIVAIIWIYKDGKARGDQNSIIWMIVEFLFPPVGLIVYLFVRPKGDFTPCPNCHQKKLATLAKCPHCMSETAAK